MLGNELVAKASGDGYTVLEGITTMMQIPSLYKTVPYNLSDSALVSQIAKSADVFLVLSSSGAKTLQDFVTQVKVHPRTFNYATYGNATPPHLHGEQLKMKAGIDLMKMPYWGSGPEMGVLLDGQVTSASVDATVAYPHLKSDNHAPCSDWLTALFEPARGAHDSRGWLHGL